ncbi:MAG: deoxyhypusine synthase family protein, partial [Acidobacteriota bacterium]
MSSISRFMETNFRHFNARETLDAAQAWNDLLARGGKMFLTMAGAMSTCELGISLAEMIRQDKVHAISCTAANLEEDLFNLFNHNEYKMVPEYRDLSPEAEKALYDQGFNRVTDTCIPEGVLRQVQRRISKLWAAAAEAGKPMFPYEYMYALLDQPDIEQFFQVPKEHSWVLAAKEKGLTIYSPGFEDSTLGNIFCAEVILGHVKSHNAI